MRPVRALAIYLAVVFLGGALLAPGLYGAVQSLAQAFPAFQKLAAQPFSRYLTRCFMALALLGLWPLVRALGVRSLAELGLPRPSLHAPGFLTGFLLGFGSLAVLLTLAVLLGARTWDTERSSAQIVRHLVNATLSAAVVGVLEELLFRGAIFGGLKRAGGFASALAISSGLYAILHFFAPVHVAGQVHWLSGLQALPQMFAGFFEWAKVIPGFFNLALVGAILAIVFERTGALYASIGLHAGWIFWLKTGGFFTHLTPSANVWLWGTNRLIDGWLTLPLLALVMLAAFRLFSKPPASC